MNTAKTVRIGKTVYTVKDIHAYAKKWHSSDTVMLNSICNKWLKENDNHCQKPRKAVKTEDKKQTAKKATKKAIKTAKKTAKKTKKNTK